MPTPLAAETPYHAEPPSPPRPLRARLLAPALLAACTLLIASLRLHTYFEPLERDITTYAVIGHELLRGRPLYADLWDHKPPLVHVTFAATELVVGYGRTAVFFLGLSAAVVTLLGVFRAARHLGSPPAAALWGAVFWTLISSDPELQANQPNTEVFFNACLIWAFALLLSAPREHGNFRRAALVGFLLALATLYKQVAAVTALFLAAALVAVSVRRRAELRSTLARLGVMAAVAAAIWAAVIAWFWLSGSLRDFFDAVFVYNRHYVGSLAERLRQSLDLRALFPPALAKTAPLFLLAFAAAALAAKRSPRACVLLAAYAFAAPVQVALLGSAFPHYYQVWLPVLAVGGAWGIAELGRRLRWRPLSAHLLAACVAAYLAPYTLNTFTQSAENWSLIKYQDSVFVAAEETAAEISALLRPGERFYEWGNETGLYFVTRISPPAGVFYAYPLAEGPLRRKLCARVLADLEREQPELALIMREAIPPENVRHPVLAWLVEHYLPMDTGNDEALFLKYARKNGRLAGQLSSPAIPE